MRELTSAILEYNSRIKESMIYENNFIDYERRWCELEGFRYEVSRYIEGYDGKTNKDISSKVTVLENGHLIDHHALGYFSPMSIKRYGFTDPSFGVLIKRSPLEQIKILNDYFKDNGIRFIYVPLPCKTAIDPHIFVSDAVIPKDNMVIPQWRSLICELVKEGIEIVDCYIKLSEHKLSFSHNHHVSPIGANVIGRAVSDYIKNTTEYSEDSLFTSINDVIGSPVLSRSGDNNSIELNIDYYSTNKYYYQQDGVARPYSGRNYNSDLAIIGDCNLQCYRGTGFDVTAQISGCLRYPIKYLGRYLPFAKFDSIDKLPAGSLANVKMLIYIGFVSGCFVRACHEEDEWSTRLPSESVFRLA